MFKCEMGDGMVLNRKCALSYFNQVSIMIGITIKMEIDLHSITTKFSVRMGVGVT